MLVCEFLDWLGIYLGVLNKEQFVCEGVKFICDIYGGVGILEENFKVLFLKMYVVLLRDLMIDFYIFVIFLIGDFVVNVVVFCGEYGDGGEFEFCGKVFFFGLWDVVIIYVIFFNVIIDFGLNF